MAQVILKAWELDPWIPRPWSAIKRYWKYIRDPCARCGRPIDYDNYRYYWIRDETGMEKRIANRWSLDVGHIVARMDDPRFKDGRWDSGAKYCPAETQPEHVHCNRAQGARDGNRARRTRRRTTLRTSREW